MTEREDLITQAIALATDYYDSYRVDNCEEILRVFEEYFELIKDEDVIDKEMVGAMMLILGIFNREQDGISDDVIRDATNMYVSFHKICEAWCPDYQGKFLAGEAKRDMGKNPTLYEDLLEWIRIRERVRRGLKENKKKINFDDYISVHYHQGKVPKD